MPPDSRAERMLAQYEGGATLEEVGDDFGLTRERVRQIFKAAGYSAAEARKNRSRQKRRRIEAEAVSQLHRGVSVQEVAAESGMTVSAVRALAKKFAPTATEQVKPGSRVPNGYWNKERILDALRAWQREYGSPPHATDWNIAALRSGDKKSAKSASYPGCGPT